MRWPKSVRRPTFIDELRSKALGAGLIVGLVFLCCGVAKAQDQRPARAASSDLAQQNLGLVSASPKDIRAVLVKDAGLMVEIKRWVAKEATDHGQIINESDLTDDAIFERLDADARFRSVVTQLVQRYGYLVPKVNPDSQLGKEQELLVQEARATARGRTDCGAPASQPKPGTDSRLRSTTRPGL